MIKKRQRRNVKTISQIPNLKNNSSSLHIKNTNNISLVPFNVRQKKTQSYIQRHMKQSLPPGSYEINKSAFQKASYISSLQKLQFKPRLDIFNGQLDVKLQHQIYNSQTSSFKSRQQRFKASSNENYPGPANYNIQNQRKPIIKHVSPQRKQNSKLDYLSSLNKPTLPSIPNSSEKYGYYKTPNGQYKKVRKTSSHLQKQKEILKQYNSQQIDQNLELYYRLGGTYHMDKEQREVHSIYAKSKSNQKNQMYQIKQKQKTIIPGKLTNTLKNRKESQKRYVLIDKFNNLHIDQVGPASYNYDLNTIKIDKKNEKYQFFGSTQKRFEQKSSSSYEPKLNNKQEVFNNAQIGFINKNNAIQAQKAIRKNLPYIIRQKITQNAEQSNDLTSQTTSKEKNNKQKYQFKKFDKIHTNSLKQTKYLYLELKLPSFKKVSSKNINTQIQDKNKKDKICQQSFKQNISNSLEPSYYFVKKRKSKQIISFNCKAQRFKPLNSKQNNSNNKSLQDKSFVLANIGP